MAEEDAPRGPSLGKALVVFLLFLIVATAVVSWLRSTTPSTPSPPVVEGSPQGREIVPTPPSTVETAGTIGVFVEPGDGRAPLLDEIAAARRSIDLEVYIITDQSILAALEAAQQRGVAVRVILEQYPFGGEGGQQAIFDRLARAGIAVRWSNPVFRFSHIKTMVVDDEVALIMNLNLTQSSFTKNREFGVITTEPAAVQTAAAIFEADWNGGPEPDPGPLVVSPTNARAELLALIDGARTSLDVYAEVLRDPEMLAALAAAAQRGVDVRVVVSPSGDFAAERAQLVDAGVDLRLLSRLYIHAKVFIADGQRAFVGSQNLSATSLDQNRELGIIFDDPASIARLSRTFDLDFRAGQPEEVP